MVVLLMEKKSKQLKSNVQRSCQLSPIMQPHQLPQLNSPHTYLQLCPTIYAIAANMH